MARLAELEEKRAAWAPVLDDSSSASSGSHVSDEPETGVDEEDDEKTEREKQRRR